MANNRMALVCSVCGEGKAIAKYYPSTGWYPTMAAVAKGNIVLEQWMDKHWNECSLPNYSDDGGAFRLAYESDGMTDWHYAENAKLEKP